METAETELERRDGGIPVASFRLGSWRLRLERQTLTSRALAEAYSCLASRWGRLISRLGFDAAYEALLREQQLTPDQVLEVGAGTGAFTSALGRVARRPFAVEGLDLSRTMLDHALVGWRAQGLKASGCAGDLLRLPYGDGAFDVVLAAHVIEHVSDVERAASEVVRVLRPGGTAVIVATRSGLLGRYIQWKWRVRCFTAEGLRGIFPSTVSVCVQPMVGPRLCRWLSWACVVTKPAS